MPICEEPVPLLDFGAGHVARCYLYDERADAQKPIPAENAPRGFARSRRAHAAGMSVQ